MKNTVAVSSNAQQLDRIAKIDALLAQALVATAHWPKTWGTSPKVIDDVIERAFYHGIAGLLSNRGEVFSDWPAPVHAALRQQALGQAMWEARHHALLRRLLAALAARGIRPLLLKGTALAYDLYEFPAQRPRGDTDIVIDAADIAAARIVLRELDFSPFGHDEDPSGPATLEEAWEIIAQDGTLHTIDMHVQVIATYNARDVFPYAEMLTNARTLSRLAPEAISLDLVSALMHASVHRAAHIHSPYFTGGRRYKGGDRLIWLMDIHLLLTAFSATEWDDLCCRATQKGLAKFCLDGMEDAAARLGTRLPEDVRARLRAAGGDTPLHRQYHDPSALRRNLRNVIAVPGVWPKVSIVWKRIFPSRALMNAKYPHLVGRPLGLLYVRRIGEVLRRSQR